MPPRGVKSQKRKRQYEHVKKSASARGKSPRRAKEIASRTVNKARAKSGETKKRSSSKSAGSKGRSTTRKSGAKRSRSRS